MTYHIQISSSAEKNIKKISKKYRSSIVEQIDSLSANPRPEGCKKLQGKRNPALFRIRIGVYRVVYAIQNEKLIVLVLEVGHRKDIYR